MEEDRAVEEYLNLILNNLFPFIFMPTEVSPIFSYAIGSFEIKALKSEQDKGSLTTALYGGVVPLPVTLMNLGSLIVSY